MKYLLVSLIFFGALTLSAQDKMQTVKGTVVDKQSGVTLPGATVILENTDPPVGTVTDIDGRFRLENVPVGRQSISISFIGYEPATISNLEVTSGKEVVLNIELQEKVFLTKEVVVTAKRDKDKPLNKMATVSARTFSVEEASRYAGSFNDVARRAANFAGVVSASDQRNDIIIRGNSPNGLLWRLEGLDIPNPNHFANQGSNGGPVSILNNNLLANSDFFTGAFPSEYGNSLSGVFDLKLRNGNRDKHEYIAQFGLNGLEFMSEGPLNKKHNSSYLASYRYSTLDIMNKLGIKFGTSGLPRYQDLSFKTHHKTGESGILTVFGIGGISDIEILAKDKKQEDNSFGIQDNSDAIFGTDMGVFGITHKHFFNNKTSQKIILGASGSRRSANVDTLDSDFKNPFNTYKEESTSYKLTLGYYLNTKYSAKSTLKSGFYLDKLGYASKETTYSNMLKDYRYIRDFDGSSYFAQIYTQWHYRLNAKLTLNPGVHVQHYFYNGSNAVEPRFGLKYEVNEKQSLSLGYGYHSQLQLTEMYFYESVNEITGERTKTNEDLGFTNSHHFVVGLDRRLSKNVRLKLETYYQQLSNMAVQGNQMSSFSGINLGQDFGGLPSFDTLVNGGSAYNYGLEFTLEKFFSKGYYFLLTTSLFDSKYEGSDGVEHPTTFATNYVANGLVGVELKIGKEKSNAFTLDLRLVAAGGKRFTPIDLQKSIDERRQVEISSQAFAEQFIPYSRVDFKIGYKINAKKVTHLWAFDAQNILNRKNILMQRFNPLYMRVEQEYQLGLFPVFLYQLQF